MKYSFPDRQWNNSLIEARVHNLQDIIQKEVNKAPDGKKQNDKFENFDKTGFLLRDLIFLEQRFPFLRRLQNSTASRTL